MKTCYVRITVLNSILSKSAEKMVKTNRYGKLEDGKYFKNIKIVCKCRTTEDALVYITNKFNNIARDNNMKFKIELFQTPKYDVKIAERLTETYGY